MCDQVAVPLNRLLYRYLIDLEVKRAVRYSRFLSICHIGLDGTRKDDFAILNTTAEIVHELIRETDVYSYIDDGILSVLLHNTDSQQANLVGNRIRHRIAEQTFILDGASLQKTASVGGACFPTHVDDPTTLLLKADEMLETARLRGGNTVVFPD